ncbi:MAG: Uma2 family endonuclease [Caldilineaceae bacterium]
MTVQVEYRQFTVADLEQMIASGILAEDEHIELIEGQLVKMSHPGILHAACVDRLNKTLSRQVTDDILISVQNPIATHTHTQPEPDLCLLAPRDDYYTQGRPTPANVLLLIEVSDSSLQYDQETKLPLYATAGIGEVWIVNLPEQPIDCYSGPTPHGYRRCERFFPGDTIHPDTMPDVTVDVQYILNPLA